MLTVAVTGGIGSGKSTVSHALADLGAVVVDSDRLAREVVAPGTPGLRAVVEAFGPGVLAPGGSLDRGALASIVFADAGRRALLESITHPLVRAAFRRERDAAGPEAIVINDIPLVRTAREAAAFHLVIGVGAGDETRVRRLVGRGMDPRDARARMHAQIDDERRRTISDGWISNDGDERTLRGEVRQLWEHRLVPMAENIAARRRAPRPAPALAEPDPRWAAQARLLCARLSALTGAPCEHVGSTAVPGLPAKDVIDLQLAVDDLDAADARSDDLGRAGFPLVPGIDRDHPHGGEPDAGWSKRLHANADPCRAVNLHVRVRGSANWRWALLFRDWLRAVPAERAAYLAAKRAATRQPDIAGYADAEEPWLAAADHRMQAWARATGWQPG